MCVCECVSVVVSVEGTRELRVTIVAGQRSTVKTNHLTKQRLAKHTVRNKHTHLHTHTYVEMLSAAEYWKAFY